MREGMPSITAQRVAAARLGFDRLPAPFGDPSADERLALDVASSAPPRPAPSEPSEGTGGSENMARYLRGRTSFFDRVVINALERHVAQVIAVGAGYDGRALRYAKPGVRWWEVDHPDTQGDKRARLERLGIDTPHITFVATDLTHAGLESTLVESGFEPDALSLIVCEGVAVYLDRTVLERLLGELRSLATVGTRLALSLSTAGTSPDRSASRARFQASVAAVGEPARPALTSDDASELLTATRWRPVDLSERARRAGFVVAAPSWVPDADRTPTASRMGTYMEGTFHRSGIDDLPDHLRGTYGIAVSRLRELDVGVFHVERDDGPSWVARVFPASRPVESAQGDAEILQTLERSDFPAERCAHPDPVSTHCGQPVVVTEYVPGKTPVGTEANLRRLGDLLGRLHTLPASPGAWARPGGAWHHLAFHGGPREEIAAAVSLLDDAEPRVQVAERPLHRVLRDELVQADDGHDLPHAPVHPDFVPPNVIASPRGDMVVVDWTGAGTGPRVASLGFLLWVAGGKSPRCVDAVVSAYRSHVHPEPEELDRLPAFVGARPLIFGCWGFCTGSQRLSEVVTQSTADRASAAKIAARARAQFDSAR